MIIVKSVDRTLLLDRLKRLNTDWKVFSENHVEILFCREYRQGKCRKTKFQLV